jgi:hypothetical protein
MGNLKLLRKGKNVLAVYSNVEFVRGDESKPAGQIDVYLEGMRKSDLE